MGRVRLWTAPDRMTGELYAKDLENVGVHVDLLFRWTGLVWYNPTPIELWIDERSLAQEDVRERIKGVFERGPLTEIDGLKIEAMPLLAEMPDEPRVHVLPPGRMIVLALLLIVAVIVFARYALSP